MSSFKVTEPHSLSPEDARLRVGAFEDLLKKYKVKPKWKGNDAVFKGPGVSGDIKVGAKSVDVSVKLGMLAKAAGIDGKRLEGTIRRRLREALDS